MASESADPKSGSTQTASEPPAVAADVKSQLEKALAEIERLAKDHAATRTSAERQAADLTTLRRFHEKAHAEIERLKTDKAVLAAEKEGMEKKVADAVQLRRKFEQAQADADRLMREVRHLEAEKAALETKIAELEQNNASLQERVAQAEAQQRSREAALAELTRLTAEQGEKAPSAATVPMPDNLLEEAAAPFMPANPLAETRAMPPISEEALPAVTESTPRPEPKAAPARSGERIKYFCEGCKKKLGAPVEFAGTFGTCKFCGHRMQVPTRSTR